MQSAPLSADSLSPFGETSHLHESFQTFVSDPELTQKVESGGSKQQLKEQSKTPPDVS